jgi:hypothetical protein
MNIVKKENEAMNIPTQTEVKPRTFRFDIFKGAVDASGKVSKLKSVGSAQLTDGCKTYTLYIKTFLRDVFYVLPEQKESRSADYVVLTREPSRNPNRKFFWNSVGTGVLLTGENAGLLKLSWDMLGCDDVYLNLYPKKPVGEM